MRYLTKVVETYRIPTVEQAQSFHEELKNDSRFTVSSFSTKTKAIKEKGEIVEEYQLVTVSKLFNIEREPDGVVEIEYNRQDYVPPVVPTFAEEVEEVEEEDASLF